MKRKTIPAFLLALALVFSLSTGALAAGTTTATVPVTLTVSNEYRAVNVTVPAALPVYVINGTVVTADNARITNNAKTGSVQVTGLSVTDGAYKVGSYDSFSGSKTIALKINGCVTTGAGRVQLVLRLSRDRGGRKPEAHLFRKGVRRRAQQQGRPGGECGIYHLHRGLRRGAA